MRPMHIEASRALNGGHRMIVQRPGGRDTVPTGTYRPGVIYRHGGYAVTMASQFPRYAVTQQRRRGRVHFTRAVLIAWRRGQVSGWHALLACGAQLVNALLTDELPDGSICGLCEYYTAGHTGGTVNVRISVETAR